MPGGIGLMRLGCITPGKLLLTPNGKIGRCPSFVYRFAEGIYARCYMDPAPPPWDSQAIYQWGDCVSYEDKTWYSGYQGPNQGNEPWTMSAYWVAYEHCDNEDWDSIPPYGGMGKSPMLYGLSFDVSGILSYSGYYPFGSTLRVRGYFVLVGGAGVWSFGTGVPDERVECQYTYTAHDTSSGEPRSWNGTLTESDMYLEAYFHINCSVGSPSFTEFWIYFQPNPALCGYEPEDVPCGILPFLPLSERRGVGIEGLPEELPGCMLQGSTNWAVDWSTMYVTHTASGRISWRPLDCNYTLWRADITYPINACVAWEGQFYRSCRANNQGHPPEADASNICETGYWWRLT